MLQGVVFWRWNGSVMDEDLGCRDRVVSWWEHVGGNLRTEEKVSDGHYGALSWVAHSPWLVGNLKNS